MKDSGAISSGSALKSVSQPQLDYFIPSGSNPPAWLSQSQTSEDLKQSRADSSGGVTLAPGGVAADSPAVQAPTVWTAHCHQSTVPPNRTMDLCDTERNSACGNTSNESSYECTRKSISMPAKANRFGIIKDISVANILTTDHDKTRDFAGKDFSQIFGKYIIPVEMEIENVFEPRPPHPELSPVPTTTREKCIFTQNETVSMVDPWQQMPSARDFRVARLPRPQFRSWKEGARGYNRHCCCSAGSFCGCCGEPDADDAPRGETTRRNSSQGLEYVSGFVTKNSNVKDGGVMSGEMAPMSECMDPADIVISSEILESLLQGAEGYDSSKCAARGYSTGDGSLVFPDSGADEMLPLPPPPDDLVEDTGATDASPDSPDLPFASQDADTDGDKDAVFV